MKRAHFHSSFFPYSLKLTPSYRCVCVLCRLRTAEGNSIIITIIFHSPKVARLNLQVMERRDVQYAHKAVKAEEALAISPAVPSHCWWTVYPLDVPCSNSSLNSTQQQHAHLLLIISRSLKLLSSTAETASEWVNGKISLRNNIWTVGGDWGRRITRATIVQRAANPIIY